MLQSLKVSSYPYGIIGRKLEVEATIKGFKDSEGEFWADTPTGKYERLAEIKTKKLSRGEEASYSAKITPKEKGYYTVAVRYPRIRTKLCMQTCTITINSLVGVLTESGSRRISGQHIFWV